MSAWIAELKKAKKTSMVQDGLKKLHFTFEDGREMVEEWNTSTDTLETRKWRKPATLGGTTTWDFEVGQARVAPIVESALGMSVSNTNPVFVRCDTKNQFQWRIRNLPYSIDNYSLTVTDDKKYAVLRTQNKKYYKKFEIADMQRVALFLDEAAFSLAHANNTLIITYAKPQAYLDVEKQLKRMRDTMKSAKDGDVDCATQ
eukprot:m.30019 g.30019  ORF g.30019 m.30019 type:complete len:201 (+) comp16200_c0_seq2:210-812(+)